MRLSIFALLWLVASGALAEPESLRLGDILRLARAADARFASARAAADAGREKLPQARAGLLPTLNLTHSGRHNSDGSTLFPGTKVYDAGGTSLLLSQPLFRRVAVLGIAQAEFQVQLSLQQLAQAEQDLLLRVARGYFDVLQAGDELTAARAQQDALTQQLAQAKRAFEVGTVPITDWNEAQARFDLAQAQEIAAGNELESKKRVLERSIAVPLPPLAQLRDEAGVEWLSQSQLAALVQDAPNTALPVQFGRLQLQVADKEVERRQASHEPTVDAVASLSSNRNVNYGAAGGSNTRQLSIGLEVSLPLFQGGAIDSRIREALADKRRATEDLTEAERQARLDAQQAQLGVLSGAALTRALRQAVSSSQTQLRSTQRGLEVGIRTQVDLLNAEQQLYATRKDLAAARYRTLLAGLQLKAVAGQLRDTDLRALDAMLGD